MKPDKFIGIMLITLLLSCEVEEQELDKVNQKVGEVVFESNQYILSSSFDIETYIDGEKIGNLKNKLKTNLKVGVHNYEIKIYSYNGTPCKIVKGKFIISENKTSEIFIDFTKYNSWI